MKLSPQGRALIKGFEGLSLKAYPDTKKGYSIGYGHFGAKPGDVITLAEADRLFDQDAIKYETAVSYTTPTALQHEYDAMVSLAYNIGTGDLDLMKGGFAGSTVARMHNMGDKQSAADAFRMWRLSDGAVNPVLVKRREKELGIYLHGYGGGPYSPPPSSTPVEPAPIASNVPSSNAGWPQAIAEQAPRAANDGRSSITPASIAAVAVTALGWFFYRLLHR
jgi:lysozyme